MSTEVVVHYDGKTYSAEPYARPKIGQYIYTLTSEQYNVCTHTVYKVRDIILPEGTPTIYTVPDGGEVEFKGKFFVLKEVEETISEPCEIAEAVQRPSEQWVHSKILFNPSAFTRDTLYILRGWFNVPDHLRKPENPKEVVYAEYNFISSSRECVHFARADGSAISVKIEDVVNESVIIEEVPKKT